MATIMKINDNNGRIKKGKRRENILKVDVICCASS